MPEFRTLTPEVPSPHRPTDLSSSAGSRIGPNEPEKSSRREWIVRNEFWIRVGQLGLAVGNIICMAFSDYIPIMLMIMMCIVTLYLLFRVIGRLLQLKFHGTAYAIIEALMAISILVIAIWTLVTKREYEKVINGNKTIVHEAYPILIYVACIMSLPLAFLLVLTAYAQICSRRTTTFTV